MRELAWGTAVALFFCLAQDAHDKTRRYKFTVLFCFWWAALYLVA